MTGFPGGPGVATMYFLDANTAAASVSSFWNNLMNLIPADVSITPEAFGDTIEDSTGVLTGSWASGASAQHQGNIAGAYSAPSGGVVTWTTGTVLDGHRLRGRTFVVPLVGGAYQADGSLADTTLTTMRSAAQALIFEQSQSFVVWHRPFKGRAATLTRPARPAHAGGHGLVTGSRVPDIAAVLRSRRN